MKSETLPTKTTTLSRLVDRTLQLNQVSQAIIVSRLRYALPVWLGFLTVDLINRIQSTLKRLYTRDGQNVLSLTHLNES